MHASKTFAAAIWTCAVGLALIAGAQAQEKPPAGATPLGRSTWDVLFSKITVADMQKSYDFYTKVIGLKPAMSINAKEPPKPPPAPDQPGELGLNFSGSFADPFFDILPARGNPVPREFADKIVVGFKVPDAAAVIKRVKDAGYEVIREATVGQGGVAVGFVRDPDGYRLEIIQAGNYPPK